MPSAAPKDLSARAGELQAELDQIRAEARPGEKVMLRVMPPHDSFTYGGIVVGADPTPVPVNAVARLTGAADEAGVTLKEA